LENPEKIVLPKNFEKPIWLSFLAYCSLISIFALLPTSLFLFKSDLILLLNVAFIYIVSLTAAVTVIFNDKKLGFSRKQARSLAIEFIMCPPFTINVVRRITNVIPINFNLIVAAKQLLDNDEWEIISRQLLELLNFEIQEAEDFPGVVNRLINAKAYILERSLVCPQ
jgi:hypothetical protein